MVQKHALYDDEFRKALGLKYGSGGERSLELLQGILIYCAWYVACSSNSARSQLMLLGIPSNCGRKMDS